MAKQAPKRSFCLIRWIEDESVFAIPTTSIKPGRTAYTGALGEFKWLGKYYEGEVLGISGEWTILVSKLRT